ncbi:hypothetical protein QTI66_08980 [Variovorax sp. J22R133]|uniref:hypothetical protein n=1 Tax=Variovorax brevis TaxID=3053503 RepID=UPI002575C00B|nr:hypothetical protein [Variovorax sp. J22R133]MDM0112283.1 hypothetical protein [Variovorax sp. J22R133]
MFAATTVFLMAAANAQHTALLSSPAPAASMDAGKQTPQVTEELSASHATLCKWAAGAYEATLPAEIHSLYKVIFAQSIPYEGAAYALLEVDAGGKPTPRWQLCIGLQQREGLPAMEPESPYFTTTTNQLMGVAASCPAGPSLDGGRACLAALTANLEARGLFAIGSARIGERAIGDASVKVWVPYREADVSWRQARRGDL